MLSTYKSHPEEVKQKIALTRNPYLFPDLNIPRTTALYWIKNRRHILNKTKKKVITNINHILEKERAKIVLLTALRDSYIYFEKNKSAPKAIQLKTVREILKARKYLKLKDCLALIGLPSSKYKRWAYTKKECQISAASQCQKRYPGQLTKNEVEQIKILYERRKYAYYSNTSLYKLAVKKEFASCSKETWFKYIKILKIQRRRVKKKVKKYPIGIRATKKNEILHMDITHIRVSTGQTIYLQVLMDNFTRKVISWSLCRDKSYQITLATLQKVLKKKRFQGTSIMSDAGGENLSTDVKKVIFGSGLKQLIAKSDIHFSNSVVEAFFRSLKNNFLYKLELKSFDHAYKKIKFYINKHNSEIPHSAFKWVTPNELYRGVTDEDYEEKLTLAHEKQLINRYDHNKHDRCPSCT